MPLFFCNVTRHNCSEWLAEDGTAKAREKRRKHRANLTCPRVTNRDMMLKIARIADPRHRLDLLVILWGPPYRLHLLLACLQQFYYVGGERPWIGEMRRTLH